MSPRRLPPIALLLLLPLAGLAAPAVPGRASVYLRPAAYLVGETYTLGDVASVPAGEPQEAGLLSLPLGRSPRRPTLIAAQFIGELLGTFLLVLFGCGAGDGESACGEREDARGDGNAR